MSRCRLAFLIEGTKGGGLLHERLRSWPCAGMEQGLRQHAVKPSRPRRPCRWSRTLLPRRRLCCSAAGPTVLVFRAPSCVRLSSKSLSGGLRRRPSLYSCILGTQHTDWAEPVLSEYLSKNQLDVLSAQAGGLVQATQFPEFPKAASLLAPSTAIVTSACPFPRCHCWDGKSP